MPTTHSVDDRHCDDLLQDEPLADLLGRIRACRICIEKPTGTALPHEPRPVLRVATTACVLICGQAPGTRVHASGMPFTDPSGDRLRDWMGVTADEFYDDSRIAIVPMGFCFPGLDAKGGDRPPRRECAPAWQAPVMAQLPSLQVVLLVGAHAQRWHLGGEASASLTETVANWREIAGIAAPGGRPDGPQRFVLPHPSWRNSGWIKKHPRFEADLLPQLRAAVRAVLDRS